MIRIPGLFLLLLLSSFTSRALEAVVAHTIFYKQDPDRGNRVMPSLETYWQINPQKIHYTTTPQKTIIARIRTDIFFSNKTQTLKQDHFILQTPERASAAELATINIIDLRRYVLPPGFVSMKLVLTDLADTTNRYVYTDSFTIAETASAPYYSELQLLDTVLDLQTESVFKKNGRQQLPSCTNFLPNSKSVLHYYGELYGGDKTDKSNFPLIQKVTISRKEREGLYSNYSRSDTVSANAVNLVSGNFPVTYLPSGNYYLNVRLENNLHRVIASGSLFFQRMNTNPIKEDTSKKQIAPTDTGMENLSVLNLDKTFLKKYTLPEIRKILKMLLPVSDFIGTQAINGFLKKPEDLYMRYFIYNHFQAINKKNPEQAWKEYSEKIKVVNKLFSSRGTQGYETERGFMYLRYGAPTEINTVENETGTQPYEVWQYDVLNQTNGKSMANAVFLFYKPSQLISDYKLLHTNVSGEVYNPGWRTALYTNAQGGTNGNSRAEQIIGNK